MSEHEAEGSSIASREREHEAMVEAALKRPGVREVMVVFRNWMVVERELNTYRSSVAQQLHSSASNSTQARQSGT